MDRPLTASRKRAREDEANDHSGGAGDVKRDSNSTDAAADKGQIEPHGEQRPAKRRKYRHSKKKNSSTKGDKTDKSPVGEETKHEQTSSSKPLFRRPRDGGDRPRPSSSRRRDGRGGRSADHRHDGKESKRNPILALLADGSRPCVRMAKRYKAAAVLVWRVEAAADDDGDIELLLGLSNKRGKFALLGGSREEKDGNSPQRTAARELEEETLDMCRMRAETLETGPQYWHEDGRMVVFAQRLFNPNTAAALPGRFADELRRRERRNDRDSEHSELRWTKLRDIRRGQTDVTSYSTEVVSAIDENCPDFWKMARMIKPYGILRKHLAMQNRAARDKTPTSKTSTKASRPRHDR